VPPTLQGPLSLNMRDVMPLPACLNKRGNDHAGACPPAPQAARMLGKPESECNLVICHLGAGSSMCAVKASGSQ